MPRWNIRNEHFANCRGLHVSLRGQAMLGRGHRLWQHTVQEASQLGGNLTCSEDWSKPLDLTLHLCRLRPTTTLQGKTQIIRSPGERQEQSVTLRQPGLLAHNTGGAHSTLLSIVPLTIFFFCPSYTRSSLWLSCLYVLSAQGQEHHTQGY